MSNQEVNPQATINNLYLLYGKKCVELEAYKNTVKFQGGEITVLKTEIKELKDNGNTGSD